MSASSPEGSTNQARKHNHQHILALHAHQLAPPATKADKPLAYNVLFACLLMLQPREAGGQGGYMCAGRVWEPVDSGQL